MKKLALIGITIFIIVGNILYLFWGDISGGGYKIGDIVGDFKLKNTDGRMLGLVDYPTIKGAIIVFTCNHCPFAKAYEDRIEALNKKYASLGFPVIAINPNDTLIEPEDSYAEMQKRAKEKGFTFAYLVDDTQEIAENFGAKRTPHIFLLKKENTDFHVVYTGAIDDNVDEPEKVKKKYLETALDELLAGKPINNKTTKAIGCTIKWIKK